MATEIHRLRLHDLFRLLRERDRETTNHETNTTMSEQTWDPVTAMCLEQEKQIAQLTKERDEMKRERDAYDTQINAWYETFETTQLTHAAARLEKAEKDRDRLRTRAEAAEAKAAECAEMRAYLQYVHDYTAAGDNGVDPKLVRILSDQCGTGWLSPEKKKVLVEALETLFEAFIKLNGCYPLPYCSEETLYRRIACDKAKQALEACK